jgi:gliding motility-associated-like protein
MFTPNADGYNDVLPISCPVGSIVNLKVYTVKGKQVFNADLPALTWDGRDKDGKILPDGNYYLEIFVSSVNASNREVQYQKKQTIKITTK